MSVSNAIIRQHGGYIAASEDDSDEMRAGRLKYFLPKGRRQGRLIAPEWFDQWLEAGING